MVDGKKIKICFKAGHILFMRRVNTVGSDGLSQKNGIHPPAVVHRAHSHIERFVVRFLYALRV